MGIVTLWHKNGEKMLEGEWIGGVPHGKVSSWHENGQLKEEGHYEHGKRVGEWKTWNEEGGLIATEKYGDPSTSS